MKFGRDSRYEQSIIDDLAATANLLTGDFQDSVYSTVLTCPVGVFVASLVRTLQRYVHSPRYAITSKLGGDLGCGIVGVTLQSAFAHRTLHFAAAGMPCRPRWNQFLLNNSKTRRWPTECLQRTGVNFGWHSFPVSRCRHISRVLRRRGNLASRCSTIFWNPRSCPAGPCSSSSTSSPP